MNSESSLVMELWEQIKEFVPAARRTDTAITILRSFEEFGFTDSDLKDLVDEDDNVTAAYRIVFDTVEYDDGWRGEEDDLERNW